MWCFQLERRRSLALFDISHTSPISGELRYSMDGSGGIAESTSREENAQKMIASATRAVRGKLNYFIFIYIFLDMRRY